ncbi:hypothetical protein A4X13_0g502 [Tilletia indica]|uniref:tRNA (guanine(10)-N(2))-methyltransferase n=1 Tax=Tilletia indica TaxID=43049 RepID=A0A177TT04_9BASI|nr:hypothetical protein A4X13_0g502 [Tilletia indica]
MAGTAAAQTTGRDLYIVHFTTSNLSFRIPDWHASCTALNIPYAFIPTPASASALPQAQDSKGKEKEIYDPYSLESTPPNWHPPELDCKPNTDPRLLSALHLVYLPSDEAARAICARSTQVKAIYAYWSAGRSYADTHTLLKTQPRSLAKWKRFDEEGGASSSWKASFLSINQSMGTKDTIERINSFGFFDFQGPISLKKAEREWGIIEEHSFHANQEEAQMRYLEAQRNLQASSSSTITPTLPPSDSLGIPEEEQEDEGTNGGGEKKRRGRKTDARDNLIQVVVGQLVALGTARDLITKMDLKKRVYIGNTSMPAEQSLLMATMALAKPGKIIYDPFAGTGSILYACAQYGAYVMGSDIDARMMKGKDVVKKGKGKTGLSRAAGQYGLEDLVLDGLGADMTQHPWRRGGIFDAIVADPPYGIRAGAKRLGRRNLARQRDEPFQMADGSLAHELSDYIAPTRPYHLLDLTRDLLDFAHYLLVPKGRLVFWLPCVNEDDGQAVEVPERAGMRLVASSTQDFGRWSRMLITVEKVSEDGDVGAQDGRIGTVTEYGKPVFYDPDAEDEEEGQAEEAGGESGTTTMVGQRYRATADSNEFRNRVYPPKALGGGAGGASSGGR